MRSAAMVLGASFVIALLSFAVESRSGAHGQSRGEHDDLRTVTTDFPADGRRLDRDAPGQGDHALQFFELPDWLAPRQSMISGLAWYHDDLILLPQQRPVAGRPSNHRGRLYSITRSALEREVAAPTHEGLPIDVWTLEAPGIDTLAGFEGFEAITFVGDTVFMTVEADVPAGPYAWLLRGRADAEHRTVRMEPPEVRIMGQSGLGNLTEEALVHYAGEVISIHEANGVAVNPVPVAHAFAIAREPAVPWRGRELPMAAVEYRVTDATAADDEGRFWVSNYLFDGDSGLHAADRLFGGPPSGSRAAAVPWIERAIELRVTHDGIVPSGRPPLYFEPGDGARNWEGIARLGTRGLILVTDKFPSTRLAFLPFGR
jgi:hypothetical protein